MLYYHITKTEYLPSICKYGLQPGIGPQSISVCDGRNAIFLCSYEALSVWVPYIKGDIVLEIELDKVLPTQSYGLQTEYISEEVIPPSAIRRALYPEFIYSDTSIRFYSSEMQYLSGIAFRYLRSVSCGDKAMYENVLMDIVDLLNIAPQYKGFVPVELIRGCLVELGDSGEYTFLDFDMQDNIPMWKHLKDSGDPDAIALSYYIHEQFYDVLDTDTGGYEIT